MVQYESKERNIMETELMDIERWTAIKTQATAWINANPDEASKHIRLNSLNVFMNMGDESPEQRDSMSVAIKEAFKKSDITGVFSKGRGSSLPSDQAAALTVARAELFSCYADLWANCTALQGIAVRSRRGKDGNGVFATAQEYAEYETDQHMKRMKSGFTAANSAKADAPHYAVVNDDGYAVLVEPSTQEGA